MASNLITCEMKFELSVEQNKERNWLAAIQLRYVKSKRYDSSTALCTWSYMQIYKIRENPLAQAFFIYNGINNDPHTECIDVEEIEATLKDFINELDSVKADTRKTEVLIEDTWVEIDFSCLKEGMKFRLFELDDTPVEGGEEYICLSDPYKLDGVNAVQVVKR